MHLYIIYFDKDIDYVFLYVIKTIVFYNIVLFYEPPEDGHRLECCIILKTAANFTTDMRLPL